MFFHKINQLNYLEKILVLWGFFWGLLALLLFFVGLAGIFNRFLVIGLFVIFLFLTIFVILKKKLFLNFSKWLELKIKIIKKDYFLMVFLIIFLAFLTLNFIVALAPELGYDALWYHLALPKIWFMTHQISYLPGGALYYSVMPRLGELIFSLALAFDPSGTLTKVIHLFFGLLWALAMYTFLRIYLARKIAFMMMIVVYGTVWVSWLSQTAYIDLIVAFYVLLSFLYFFRYLKTRDDFFLILSAVFMGFNLASKIYGLIIFAVLSLILLMKTPWWKTLKFVLIALIFPSSFYLQAYLATGNPLYPAFSVRDSALDSYLGGYHTLKDWYFHAWWRDIPALFQRVILSDFTPVFGLVVLFFLVKKWQKFLLPLALFLIFFLFWSLVPQHEPRYFLVILPVLALLCGLVIEEAKWLGLKYAIYGLILLTLVVNLIRIYQDYQKLFPVVFGSKSKMAYLKENLPIERNFYDADGFFAKTIKPSDKVLTVQVGNMFYINFPFWDWSFIPDREDYLRSADYLSQHLKTEGFTYVLLGNLTSARWAKLPQVEMDRFFELIYDNNFDKLYKLK